MAIIIICVCSKGKFDYSIDFAVFAFGTGIKYMTLLDACSNVVPRLTSETQWSIFRTLMSAFADSFCLGERKTCCVGGRRFPSGL